MKSILSSINAEGWGVDAEPDRRPGVPKERPSIVSQVRGEVGARQLPKSKIHLSIEHPDLTPVFGTSCPPRLLSGTLRGFAYRFGEGRMARWMTLLLADRVDVVESVFLDLLQLRVPNVVRERGWYSECTHADARRQRRVAMYLGAFAAVAILAMRSKRSARAFSRRQKRY